MLATHRFFIIYERKFACLWLFWDMFTETSQTIVGPSELSFLEREAASIALSASDGGSGLRSLTASLNGKPASGTDAVAVSADPLGLAAGTYPIVVTATDNLGHRTTRTFSLEITMEVAQLDELIALAHTRGLIADNLQKD
ncbi:hypothetical protein SAMN02799624_04690 [Paenibacillus sp. UNC496MF]|nr:hypothetical protein SAMN02799624_04690 [Paenibacillus sp. UNC496MF]